MSLVDSVFFLLGLNPLVAFSAWALIGLLWGIQASFGANTGYRRNLEWQTGFILSLFTSGLLVSLLYSTRPLESNRLSTVVAPNWLKVVAKFPSIVIFAAVVVMSVIMFTNSNLPPVTVLTTRWDTYHEIGRVLAILGFATFTCLGGLLGKKWFDKN